MAKCILVTGGTGKVGSIVADLLRAQGEPVRVATRTPSLRDQVRFDWSDSETFACALDAVSAVFLVAPTDRTDHLTAMRPFLEEAVRRGIGPLVLLSASSLPEGGPMMGEVQAWLHANAPRWVSLRPSWFMQNFTTQHLHAILAEGRIYSATQDGRVAFIDVADIAAVAVRALVDPAFPNGELLLTGPIALGYDDVAIELAAVMGRPVLHVRLTGDELAQRHERHGLPSTYARLLAQMDAAVATGAEDRTSNEVERITGHPAGSFGDFLQAHRTTFADG